MFDKFYMIRVEVLLWLLLFAVTTCAHSADYAVVSGVSYHFNRTHDYNERNWGVGYEMEWTADWRGVAGFYRNSFRRTTTYFGTSYQPMQWRGWRAGLFGGCFSGYGSKLVCAPLPLVSYESPKRWGVNILIVPPSGRDDRTGEYEDGLLALQWKWALE